MIQLAMPPGEMRGTVTTTGPASTGDPVGDAATAFLENPDAHPARVVAAWQGWTDRAVERGMDIAAARMWAARKIVPLIVAGNTEEQQP